MLLFFILLQLIQVDSSEIRFCYKGWQKYVESDCPFGLIFQQPTDLECYYSLGQQLPSIYDNMCKPPYTINPTQFSSTGDGFPNMVLNIPQVLMIDFLNHSTIEREVISGWIDLSSCYSECIEEDEEEDEADIINSNNNRDPLSSHDEDDSQEFDGDDDGEGDNVGPSSSNPITEAEREYITDQTIRLADYLYDKIYTLNSPEIEISNHSLDLRLLYMFTKTMNILKKNCHHPYLHHDFINRVTVGFLFLLEDMGTETIRDVELEEYEDIMDALDLCESRGASFRLVGSECITTSPVTEIVKLNRFGDEELSAQINLDTLPKFSLQKYDLFIESAWRSIDAVHGMCFSTFRPNSNMHHRYQRAMELLFNEKMRQRWANPTLLENDSDWDTWFLVNTETNMQNLQVCVRGAYEGAPFTVKLDRPIDHKRIRRQISMNEDESGEEIDFPEPNRNPHLDLQEDKNKWMTYEREGGIMNKLRSENIICLKDEEDRLRNLGLLRETCGRDYRET